VLENHNTGDDILIDDGSIPRSIVVLVLKAGGQKKLWITVNEDGRLDATKQGVLSRFIYYCRQCYNCKINKASINLACSKNSLDITTSSGL
jgi:hypothetical protein